MTDHQSEGATAVRVETLGRRSASRRALLGLTQDEVATQLGVSRVWYNLIESDEKSPSLNLLRKMADLFDVTETWLLRGDPQPASAA